MLVNWLTLDTEWPWPWLIFDNLWPRYSHIVELSLNISKTNYVLFVPPRPKLSDNTPTSYCVLRFGNEEIVQKSSTKVLGVDMDQYLNWFAHYKSLNPKLSRAVYTLNRVKNVLLLIMYANMQKCDFGQFQPVLSRPETDQNHIFAYLHT